MLYIDELVNTLKDKGIEVDVPKKHLFKKTNTKLYSNHSSYRHKKRCNYLDKRKNY